MKAKSGFILRNLAGEYVLTPAGDQIRTFQGITVMNELAAFVWEKLRRDVSRQELLEAVLAEYDIDEATAAGDLDRLLEEMHGLGIIED